MRSLPNVQAATCSALDLLVESRVGPGGPPAHHPASDGVGDADDVLFV